MFTANDYLLVENYLFAVIAVGHPRPSAVKVLTGEWWGDGDTGSAMTGRLIARIITSNTTCQIESRA
jgi:hypothetical protein